MELPSDFFVKPVKDHEDLMAFQFDFGLEGKSLDGANTKTITELDNGDLIIEGMAAVFEGVDREGENFIPGAFEKGIEAFLNGQAALCYHHNFDKCLGKVLDLKEVEGKGLYMKARVDGAVKKHPELGTIYEQIKAGSISGLSSGGFFERVRTPEGPRIGGVDFTDISVTPVAVHPGTKFAVVAGKALSNIEVPAKPEVDDEDIRTEDEEVINFYVEGLKSVFDRIGKRGQGQQAPATTTID